ncbi:MAG: hypothetical protein F6K11_04125 [Leptolyngbya sp. SIO3F4]|nr:hypothetical protein [Leptolyngbya sp. SIO3F4]
MHHRLFEPSVANKNINEAIQLQQAAYEFRQEVRYREDFEAYCQWYDATAAKHRAEVASMEKDIPLFNWFSRRNT